MATDRTLIDLHTAAAHRYHEALAGSPGEEYLARRGLLSGAERFLLGWVAKPYPGHEDRFIHTVSIPYLTRAGVVGMKFRRIDDSKPKYDQMPGQKQHLYNVQAILDSVTDVVVTEGEFDAVACTLAGRPAVGLAGANAWKPGWRRVFDGIGKVIVVTDNDVKPDGSNPGQELARRVSDALHNAVRVSLPPGHDVCSTIEAYGTDHLVGLIDSVREG